jgi:pantothenate kinase type III
LIGMRFTLDLGNSRWKLRGWADVEGEAVVRLDLVGAADGRLSELERFLAVETGARTSFAVSSVIAPELESEVEACLARHGEVLEVEPGLENRCREPERVGRDRLYAARAALDLARASCIVVDAGTALTVDAVLARPGRSGVFLGGAIAPGPELLARSLAAGTARLAGIEPEPGVSFLGRSSGEAICSGIVHGFRGAARELARGVAAESGLAAAPVVVTGGAARFLLDPPGLFGAPPLVHDDLVHLGLLAALDDSASRPRPVP